jgi:predicted cupin superfamily sugar epimerase
MNPIIQQLTTKYQLVPHPEGGYYKEIYKNQETIGGVPLATSIYFLLGREDISWYHQLQSDEIWYFHQGGTLLISMIMPDGSYKEALLGSSPDASHQVVVPRHTIFGSKVVKGDYALVGCMVSHGFTFDEFEMFDYDELLQTYPEHKDKLMTPKKVHV